MQLDIRLPIGALFTLLGLILTASGAVEGAESHRRALGHNINLMWGVVLLAFGLLFLFLARRGRAAPGRV